MYRYSVHVTCNELKYKGQNLTGDLNAVPCGLLEPVKLNFKKYNEYKIGKQFFFTSLNKDILVILIYLYVYMYLPNVNL